MIKLSIVIPIYNEEALLETVFERFLSLYPSFDSTYQISDSEIELIFVNDGSTDNSLPQLITFAQEHENCICINLARNFGHQLAITAGINASQGEAVVVIDGDLQDPPERILDLYQKYQEGYDVVYAIRSERHGESWFKLITARWFYHLIAALTRTPIVQNAGDFRLMSHRVVNIFNQMPEKHRFIRGMIPWIGFKQTRIHYKRDKRFKGKTKYSLSKMILLSIDGIISFSAVPLRLVGLTGIFISFLGFIYASYAIYVNLVLNTAIQGWTSMIIIILILGGIQLICLGVIAEYIVRIHDQVKYRPLYIIEDTYQKAPKSANKDTL